MFFNKTVKNLNRVREMVNVLLKYGFEELVANSSLRNLISSQNQSQWTRHDKPVLEYSRWERIRMVVEELGSTFIKLAQLLSNRPDLLPAPLITEFEKLQNDVPAIDFELIRQSIEKELGKSLEELFDYFDKKPLGSASIGQVHRARLHTGEDVVVKVQRPQANKKINTDLALLHDFVRLTEGYFKNMGILNPMEVVDTFEKTMLLELDYRSEARNLEQFRRVYQNQVNLYVPSLFKTFSTDKILTMEFISGCKITDIPQLEAWGLDATKIVEKGMNIYLNQIFEKGFFHADPHPGNILVRPNGTIVLIDFGMVGKLMKHQKYAFAGVMIGLANQDAKAMATHLRKLSTENDIDNAQAFEYSLNELIENFIVFGVEENGISDFTTHLQKIIYQYRLQIPGVVFLILRALAILEGIGKVLHPKFDTLNFIKPYSLKILAEQFSFKNQRNELTYSLSQLISLLYVFPVEFKFILKQLRNGDLNLNLVLKGYEEILQKLDSITNKLTLAMLISALLIASSIALNQPNATSNWFGLPFFSFGALVLASVLGFGLFSMSFFKKKK